MSRFPQKQPWDRWNGPPPGAAQDGQAQGMVYTAVVQSAPSNGLVEVTIPALHLTQRFQAHLPAGTSVTEGATVLVSYDEMRMPWVTTSTTTPPSIERGTSLPASPKDGQEYDYIADETNGIVWRLRYRSASASAHKWEFVGGAPLWLYENPGEKLVWTKSFAEDIKRLGKLKITVPFAGDYDVLASAGFIIEGAAALHLRYLFAANQTGTGLDPDNGFMTMGGTLAGAVNNATIISQGRWAGAVAGEQWQPAAYQNIAGEVEAAVYGIAMRVCPVRVG